MLLYLDLIQGAAFEEISHVELLSKTNAQLLDRQKAKYASWFSDFSLQL
jgi:Mn-containing catalase